MFDLYHAPDQAAYRQSELYDAIANDKLAREAQGKDQSSADRISPARRVIAAMSDVLTTVTESLAAAGRRPHHN